VYEFFTENINARNKFPQSAAAPRPLGSPDNIYQYQSEGIFKQNQLIVNSSVELARSFVVRLLHTELRQQRYWRGPEAFRP
jgi:hypothetical protein